MLQFEQILSNMITEYQKISGTTPIKTSDIYIKLKVLAAQLFTLQSKLEWTKNQVFPQTATGKYLDYHAQTRGLTRKKPSSASGILTFSLAKPAENNITIPVNTLCFSPLKPDVKFATTSAATITKGELNIDIPAKCTTQGTISNTEANSITKIVNPPQGIELVTNKTEFLGGTNQEDDNDLRKRLLDNFENISNGCNSAYYHNLAMNYDGVSSVNVIPRNRGRGTVDIIIATNKPTDELAQKIKTYIQEKKEINVDIDVLIAKPKKITIDLNLDVDSTYNFTDVSTNTTNIIKNFIHNLKVAQPLNLAALGAKIFEIKGVKNYKFSTPEKDVFLNKDEIITLDKLNITKL